MPRAMWSGSISFGLVNIPVKMFTAMTDRDIHFHQLHKKDMSRIQYRMVCAAEGKEVDRDDIVKGYEIGPDQYVTVSQKELEEVAPEKSRSIDIVAFVDMQQVDPLYLEHPYYLLPDENAAKAYRLLAEAISRKGKVAIARLVLRNREYLGAMRIIDGVICLSTMRFANEVVMPKELEGAPTSIKVDEKELKMAGQLIDALVKDFDPKQYHDEYQERLREMIEKKAKGMEIKAAPPASGKPARVINLMAALERSLADARKKEPAKEPPKKKKRTA